MTIAKAKKPAPAPKQQKVVLSSSQLLESPPKKLPVKKAPVKKAPAKVVPVKKQIQKTASKKEEITIIDSDDEEKLPIEGMTRKSSYKNDLFSSDI